MSEKRFSLIGNYIEKVRIRFALMQYYQLESFINKKSSSVKNVK